MRRKQRATPKEVAKRFFAESRYYQVASTTKGREPLLRVLNGVVCRDWILFHGALAGEKNEALGSAAVVSAYEALATIPSYFVDPELACPATTAYKSAQAKGVLEEVSDESWKREALGALMAKYQPEGLHLPLTASAYDKEMKRLRVFGLPLSDLSGKMSLGQDRETERTRKVVQGLWERGATGDHSAIEEMLLWSPEARPESWSFQAKERLLHLKVHPSEEDVSAHARLLDGQYWRTESTQEDIATSIRNTTAWVGVMDSNEELVAAARATTDRTWVAHIFDVVVASDFRGSGVGQRMMKLLLDHRAVCSCAVQKLGTKDAMSFYEQFGFKAGASVGLPFESHAMARFNPRS